MKIKIKNPVAMALKCAMFNRRIVKSKKGKGSYSRKDKSHGYARWW